MEFAADHRTDHDNSNNNAPNNGVTNFLRHFSTNHHQHHHRTNGSSTNHHHKDGSSLQHHLKKSNRILRNLGRTGNIKSTRKDDSMVSPACVAATTTKAFHPHKMGKYSIRGEEEMIAFDYDTTRLGIRPTCYDVPETYGDSATNSLDEEIFFLNNNVVAAASVTPLSTSSTTSKPNLFSSLPIWEETRHDELEDSTHHGLHGASLSPQKSIGSCDSIRSEGSIEEEYSTSNFTLPISSSPSKGYDGTTRNRCNSNYNSPSKKISSNLIQKAKSIVQRARDREIHSCDSSQISAGTGSSVLSKSSIKSRSSVGTTTTKHVDTVKIFLLLVEPKSKVFELIQLLYPRNKTKVSDLLKMIPNNATEQALATQSYVGITRPKRRADPITDLQLLASNSVFNSAGQPTAAIESGEIIVAIPALTNTKEIVVLSKQILASSHIQKLISISKGHSSSGTTDKSGRNKVIKKRKGGDNVTRIVTTKSPSRSLSSPRSPNYVTSFSPIQENNSKEFRSPKIVSFTDESYTEELKRAVENANLANEEAGCSPSNTPTSFLSESVVASDPAKTVDFPRDMLDAYMSKDAVLKMCSTPSNYKIPNIECTSSSSMVDDTDDTDVDVSSCDGSMTSSFHSWAQSLDSTSIPSLHRSTGMVMDHGVVVTSKLQIRKKKRFITKKMKRAITLLFLSSIARYHHDPNGIYTTQDLRHQILFEPMGLIGFFYFIITFAMLVKMQKYYRRRFSSSSTTTIPSQHPTGISRCPTLRFISKMYKQWNLDSSSINDSHHQQQQLVPTSIHAIKFG